MTRKIALQYEGMESCFAFRSAGSVGPHHLPPKSHERRRSCDRYLRSKPHSHWQPALHRLYSALKRPHKTKHPCLRNTTDCLLLSPAARPLSHRTDANTRRSSLHPLPSSPSLSSSSPLFPFSRPDIPSVRRDVSDGRRRCGRRRRCFSGPFLVCV